jgi:hypothetical protein
MPSGSLAIPVKLAQGYRQEIVQGETLGTLDMSGALGRRLALLWFFRLHGASETQMDLIASLRRRSRMVG